MVTVEHISELASGAPIDVSDGGETPKKPAHKFDLFAMAGGAR
jgi:hypothetical protein